MTNQICGNVTTNASCLDDLICLLFISCKFQYKCF